jgi:hypothetical protein
MKKPIVTFAIGNENIRISRNVSQPIDGARLPQLHRNATTLGVKICIRLTTTVSLVMILGRSELLTVWYVHFLSFGTTGVTGEEKCFICGSAALLGESERKRFLHREIIQKTLAVEFVS